MELSPFAFFTLILLSALLAMAALQVVRAPTIPAYFIAGVVLGPSGLGVLFSSDTAHFVGELGIVLLLFTIGLKFNVRMLLSIRRFTLGLGTMQVAFTALAVSLPAWLFVDDVLVASLIGFMAAMSSTAIVSQLLLKENAVTSPVGRRSIAVLLLQDILVIPLIVIYSNQSGEESLAVTTALVVAKIVALFLVVLLVAPRIMTHWLNWVSRYGDKELFIVNIIAVISVFSVLTGAFGLSYVLGAFLAGMLISETFHRHQVEQIVEPFRQLLLGFFFITLGIFINPAALMENILLIVLLTAALLVVKFLIIYFCARSVKSYQVTASRTAFLLSGTGEFGFVLLSVAAQSGILSEALFQLLVPVNVLAMIIVPLFWKKSEGVIQRVFPEDWRLNAERMKKNMLQSQHLKDHIIICGLGRTGQSLAATLRTVGMTDFIILEEDYVVLDAVDSAERVIYGSSNRNDSLLAAGIQHARILIVTHAESVSAVMSVQNARRLNPSLHIIAKAATLQQKKALCDAGADDVLVDAHETGFAMAEKGLRQLGSKSLWMLPHTFANARSGKNLFFQAEYMHSTPDKNPQRLSGCHVTKRAPPPLKELPDDVEVVAWRRSSSEMDIQREDDAIAFNDQLILFGSDQALERARKLLAE